MSRNNGSKLATEVSERDWIPTGQALISIYDLNGLCLFINDIFLKVTGYSETELLVDVSPVFGSKRVRERLLKKLNTAFAGSNIWTGEVTYSLSNGKRVQFRSKARLIANNGINGSYIVEDYPINPDAIEGDEVGATQMIELNSLSEGLCLVDIKKGSIYHCNQRFCEILKNTDDLLKDKPIAGIFKTDEMKDIQSFAKQRSTENSDSMSAKIRQYNGELIDVTVCPSLIRANGQEFLQLVINPVSSLSISQSEIQDVQWQYKNLVDYATDIIYYTDINGYFTFVNKVASEIFGYSEKEIIGHHFTEFVSESSLNEIYGFYKSMRFDGIEKTYNEFEVRSKDGQHFWVGQNVHSVTDPSGDQYFVAVARNISTKKSHEETLRRNEQIYRIINNFSTSLLGSNSIEEILWDITYNCVAKMDFEDCLVFLFNNQRRTLIQRAAYGSDKTKNYSIEDPIIIEIGEGIVGSVAQTGRAILSNDVRKDPRYIAHDQATRSEMAVPIVYEGEVIGVIDSEHSKVDFFREYHLEVLQMIASLAANKLMRTVSIQKQQDSERKYRGIIEKMDMGIVEVDKKDVIMVAYPKFCEMVGYSKEELIGKSHIDMLFVKKYLPVLEKQNLDRERGIGGVYEVQLRRKDGQKIWVLISGTPISDSYGALIGTVGIHHDITREKNLQKQLKRAKKRAEKAQNAEKQFLANMSHEIRTPLNAIIGMSYLLAETKLNDLQREYLAILQSSSNLLLSLISDILDISKIDAGSIEIQESSINLLELVEGIHRSFVLKTKEKGVKLIVDADESIDVFVISDSLLLNQILLNLTSNAVKFTESGEIRLSLKQRKVKGEIAHIYFEVSDTGIGIPELELPTIFNQFKQVTHKSGKKYVGTGLGLAITKKLVELLGGNIKVESTFHLGSKFFFTLPMKRSSEKLTAQPTNKISYNGKFVDKDLRLLIVEDNPMNQKYICTLLQRWDMVYDLAENGVQAIRASSQVKYDLIFMDLQMPEMDGFEATRRIRDNQMNADTPIIAISASTFLSKKKLALETGMSDFLSKPFTPAQLLQVLEKHLILEKADTSEQGSMREYIFSSDLDDSILQQTYEGDLEYAVEMFDLFIETIREEVDTLFSSIQSGRFEDIKSIAHRIKPSFGMVGLSRQQDLLAQIELCATKQDAEGIRGLGQELKKGFDLNFQVVEKESKRIRGYLNEVEV